MIWVIIVAIIVFIAFKIGSTSGQVVGSVSSNGGMRVKYARLLENILGGHQDCKIFAATRTYKSRRDQLCWDYFVSYSTIYRK